MNKVLKGTAVYLRKTPPGIPATVAVRNNGFHCRIQVRKGGIGLLANGTKPGNLAGVGSHSSGMGAGGVELPVIPHDFFHFSASRAYHRNAAACGFVHNAKAGLGVCAEAGKRAAKCHPASDGGDAPDDSVGLWIPGKQGFGRQKNRRSSATWLAVYLCEVPGEEQGVVHNVQAENSVVYIHLKSRIQGEVRKDMGNAVAGGIAKFGKTTCHVPASEAVRHCCFDGAVGRRKALVREVGIGGNGSGSSRVVGHISLKTATHCQGISLDSKGVNSPRRH